MRDTGKSTDLGNDSVRSLFFYYYVPTLISMVSVTSHQLINGIILGQKVGKEAIAAVGLYAPILLAFISLLLPLMIGGGITFSRSIGAKNYQHAQQVFRFTTTLVLLAGSILAVGAPLLAAPIATFIAGQESPLILTFTTDYIFWNFVFVPFLFLRFLWGTFLNNDNAPKVNKNVTVFSSVLNIVLDVLLVIVFPFGIAGAAIATGLSLLAAIVYILVYLRKGSGHLNVRHFRPTLHLSEWRSFFRVGFPSFVSEVSGSLGLLLLSRSLQPYGVLAISAFGLINFLNNIFLRLFTASMMSIQPIIGFNIGARQPERVQNTLRFALLFTLTLGSALYGIGLLFPTGFVRVVAGKEGAAFRQVAADAIRYSFLLYIVAGPNFILAMYMQTIGQYTVSILISVLKGVVLIGLLLSVLPPFFTTRLDAIWLARPLAEIITLLGVSLYTVYYRHRYYAPDAILKG